MSSVAEASVAARVAQPLPGLSRPAARWLAVVLVAAATVGGSVAWSFRGAPDWGVLVLLLAGSAVAQARATQMPRNQVFHTGFAFTVAAALLLPPAALVLVCLIQHVPDWIRQRYPWYIQTFNICNYVLSGIAAWSTYNALLTLGGSAERPVHIGAAAAGGVAFVAVNHVLLAVMLRLARGHSLRSTGLFSLDSTITDLALAATGVIVALLAQADPWATPIAVAPLVLIHRALVIPALREEARRDPKTDLLNQRGLDEAASREVARAARFDRPLSVLAIDIDDLRGINNRHGHLAGDAALRGLATLLLEARREYDVCARVGGDEFVMVLPETTADEAAVLKRRLLGLISGYSLRLHADEQIPISASIGTATRVKRDSTVREIIRRADEEMLAAKRAGRAAATPAS
jgi:diguanylate cyclase (GGDEF)-like protein